MNSTQIYTGIPVVNHLFNWWSVSLWALAFVLMILLLTNAWRYVWHLSITMAIIGFLSFTYAAFTANWFIGWFAWTPFLGGALFIRGLIEKLVHTND